VEQQQNKEIWTQHCCMALRTEESRGFACRRPLESVRGCTTGIKIAKSLSTAPEDIVSVPACENQQVFLSKLLVYRKK